MKLKLLLFTALLMFVVLTGILLYKGSVLLYDIEDELINYLEENYQIQLEVREPSFWPLNQIILKDAKISSTDNQFTVNVPEISIYYDILALLTAGEKPGNAIDFISLKRPSIEVNQSGITDQDIRLSESELEKRVTEVLSSFYMTSPLLIKVEEGTLAYNSNTNNIELEKLNLILKVVSEEECHIQLDTDILLGSMILGEYSITDKGLENLKIVMQIKENNWQGNLETDYIQLAEITRYFSELENSAVNLKDIQGYIKPTVSFQGTGLSLDRYKGEFSVSDGGGDLYFQESALKELALSFPDIINENFNSERLWDRAFNISYLQGNIVFDSVSGILSTDELDFNLNDNTFKFNGRIENITNDQEVRLFGHLRTGQLDINTFDILTEETEFEGPIVMDYTVEGVLSDLDMNLDLSLSEGEINDLKIENMLTTIRYYQGNTYLDQLNFIIDETNQFTLSGLLKNSKKEYSFDFEGRDLDIGLLNKSAFTEITGGQYTDANGTINITASITGSTMELEGLNASGQLEVIDPSFLLTQTQVDPILDVNQVVGLKKLFSDFYLSKGKLFLHQGRAAADWGEMNFSGELDIIDNNIDIKINSPYISSGGFIAEYGGDNLGLSADEDITGALKLDGSIQGILSSPQLTASITGKEGSVLGYRFEGLNAGINYEDKKININNLELYYHQSLIKGHAIIDMDAESSLLNGELSINRLSYEVISSILRSENLLAEPLPAEGNIGINLSFNGLLSDPAVLIEASSQNTNLYIKSREFGLDRLQLYARLANGGVNIEDITASVENGSFQADGFVSQESIDIGYQLDDFPLKYDPAELLSGQDGSSGGQSTGRLNIKGGISGDMSAPVLDGQLGISDINYQQNFLGSLNGTLKYSDAKLALDSIIWKKDENKYIIDGEVSNILSDPELDISVYTENGHLRDFEFTGFSEEFESFSLYDYYFTADAIVKGQINNPQTWLNLDFINLDNAADIVQVYGSISDRVDLSVKGEGVTIDKFMNQYTDAGIDGELQFAGSVTGEFDSVGLSLDTSMTDAVFGEITVEDIHGMVEITEGTFFRFDQRVIISADSSMNVSGSIPFEQGLSGLNINTVLEDFPLQLVSVYSTYGEDMSGLLSGEVELSGGLDEPTLMGRLNMEDTAFNVGLPDQFADLSGDIILEGRKVSLENMSGKYGDGNISLTGSISPFAQEENWDLSVSGENLPFDYGSFKGEFDSDLIVTGSLMEPMIKADIVTHQFDVRMPFEWPASEGDNNSLLFDLTLYPGEDVHLVNQNINVLIQEGSLNINNLEGDIIFRGELSSQQGTFDFYNNKFILEEGSATFERQFDVDNAYIPEVDVEAWTNVSGTRVEVLLSGPANNMVTAFSSLPPLEQDEILTLLSSRGGLGEFASGDFDNVIQSELYRLIYSQLQLDFVEDIQDSIKNIFALDRLEVDVYDLGWNDQLTVYLGKHLNDRLYLEYTDVIITDGDDLTTDEQGELSLQYLLDENLSLETSWQGEDEFSLSIETNIEF
ncbi:MAG: translocation/assembly module TamB domain-containing protein [Halanaerobiales bacterium]